MPACLSHATAPLLPNLQAVLAPDVEITAILTCNSITPTEGALYVCVPSADGEEDGHDYADEVR